MEACLAEGHPLGYCDGIADQGPGHPNNDASDISNSCETETETGGGGGGGSGSSSPRVTCWDGSEARTPALCPTPFFFENPRPESFQSGIGVISGWVCEARFVSIWIRSEGEPQWSKFRAAYGTPRADTRAECGDIDNGFGLLVNWNLFGPGPVEVWFGFNGKGQERFLVHTTTLGGEFAEGLAGRCEVADFPDPGSATALEWSEALQNFVIVGVE